MNKQEIESKVTEILAEEKSGKEISKEQINEIVDQVSTLPESEIEEMILWLVDNSEFIEDEDTKESNLNPFSYGVLRSEKLKPVVTKVFESVKAEDESSCSDENCGSCGNTGCND